MSSLIGYTRWHVPHLSAVPFLTSVTGVLQFGTRENFEQFGVDGHASELNYSILR